MKAKDYLSRAQKLEMIIDNKKAELERWEAIATSIGAIYNGERVQTSASRGKMENAICKCVEIEKEINNNISRLEKALAEINEVIEQLPPIEYDLLHKVYIQNQPLQYVAMMKGKSRSWATTTQNRAFKKVQQMIDRKDVR